MLEKENQGLAVMAVLIGKPQDLDDGKGHVVKSAINKTIVEEALYLTETHFEGDEQADTKNHGGADKAVLGYSFDHYPYWTEKLGMAIDYGAFGENLTIKGITEASVHIGDVFRLDDAVIEVSQPRQPCFKLAFKHRVKEMPLWVEENGRSGIYFRVLKEGWVSSHPDLTVIEKGRGPWTLAEINRVLFSKTPRVEHLKEIVAIEKLTPSLKRDLLTKCEKL